MEKIKVKICIGTTCFIMGGSELQNLSEFLPEKIKDKVEIIGSPCISACKNDNYGKAPFVNVNGQIIEKASIDKIITILNNIIFDHHGDNRNEP